MLRALQIEDMEPIRKWRNQCLDTLRTPFPLTKEQQEQWYRDVVCNRSANARFWAITDNNGELIGYCGLENIQWENSIAEISMLINPECQRKGLGKDAFAGIMYEAWHRMNINTVFAECYENNPAVHFWRDRFSYMNGTEVVLPNRKYTNEKYVNSIYFSVSRLA